MEVYELSECASALPKEDAEAAVRSWSRRKNGGQNNMKKDCRNIFTFVEEWKRRGKIKEIPHSKYFNVADITVEDVNKLQQWSDEHQVKTRREEFERIFPEVDIHTLNPCVLGVKPESGCMQSNCYNCWEEFWNKEVKEV